MEINQNKSKILTMNVKSIQPDIYLPQGKLEAVHSLKYFGTTITEDGGSVSKIKQRIAIATGVLKKMKVIWKD